MDIPRTADSSVAADLVVMNGTILTLDGVGRRAGALAASGGKIVAVDSDRAITGLIGADTRVLDLAGRTAIPGFVESHNHPAFFGLTLAAQVDAGTPQNDSIADIVERVREAVRHEEPGNWIRGYRYDDSLLADDRHPTRSDLDPVSPDNPVLLTHVTGHFCVANSAALRLAGIDAGTPDPPGGQIDRDPSGEPTGFLLETAAFMVNSQVPDSGDDIAGALRLASAQYARNGVTTVHDAGIGLIAGPREIDAYRALVDAGGLATRVHGYLFHQYLPGLDEGDVEPPDVSAGTDRFSLTGVKIVADGSIQGLTGCLAEGYTCAPDEHGMMLLTPDELSRRVATLDAAGWQVAVHGNGDAAIEAIINAYSQLGVSPGQRRRHRIEHCQTVREDQLDRMAENDVLASFFVKHVYYWGDRHRDRFLGPERARRISPLASARSRGLRFGLHSDTPVTPVPPMEGIWCAVNRITRDGGVLGPEQAISVDAALRAYTIDAAYLGGEDASRGSLEVGKLADLAVLSADPTAVEPATLRSLTVEATVVGGETVYTGDGRTGAALPEGGAR